ncbi:MAG: SPFH domain-containing protein [Candidatus Accumulibacter sp. UW26]|jgi:regulator of protease activity HflC (stomatin/prohibitin superfamily)
MKPQVTQVAQNFRHALGSAAAGVAPLAARFDGALSHRCVELLALGLFAAAGYALYVYPPVQSSGCGEAGIGLNPFTGRLVEVHEGAALVVPGLHELRRFSRHDQVYRQAEGLSASGAPFQAVEGLSLGVDVSARDALDPKQIATMARNLPADLNGEVVQPVVQEVLYETLERYTVREIFASKRQEIPQALEPEFKLCPAADGVVRQSVTIGNLDLPRDCKAGMENLLFEGLAIEEMRYTLELKEMQVKQSGLAAEAERSRRERQSGAAAQVRRIEAAAEPDSRQKLADADAYRQDRLGKIASEQLARDGALISKNPLPIQKTLADKLADKISVIIAPPPSDGGFIGATLLGSAQVTRAASPRMPGSDPMAAAESVEEGQ